MASLQLWKQENQEDNRPRIERLLRNLPLAMEEELTPPSAADHAHALFPEHVRHLHCPGAGHQQGHRFPDPVPQHLEAVPQPAVQSVKKLTFSPEKP